MFSTRQLSKKLLDQVKNLSPNAKVILAERMFGCDSEEDNYGQMIIYTGYVEDKKTHRVRRVREDDIDGSSQT